MARGRFVAFEGGEACGKSTQAARLASRLGAVLTREPGGTPLGERVREVFLDPSLSVAPRTEALLVAAARAQHVADVIEPALSGGRHVVTDRFVGSSLAYQGHGRGLGVEAVRALSAFATEAVLPDLTVWLDVPPAVAFARRGGEGDRLESAGREFHERVYEGYRSLAAAEGWVVVDGTSRIDEVEAVVWREISGRLGL